LGILFPRSHCHAHAHVHIRIHAHAGLQAAHTPARPHIHPSASHTSDSFASALPTAGSPASRLGAAPTKHPRCSPALAPGSGRDMTGTRTLSVRPLPTVSSLLATCYDDDAPRTNIHGFRGLPVANGHMLSWPDQALVPLRLERANPHPGTTAFVAPLVGIP